MTGRIGPAPYIAKLCQARATRTARCRSVDMPCACPRSQENMSGSLRCSYHMLLPPWECVCMQAQGWELGTAALPGASGARPLLASPARHGSQHAAAAAVPGRASGTSAVGLLSPDGGQPLQQQPTQQRLGATTGRDGSGTCGSTCGQRLWLWAAASGQLQQQPSSPSCWGSQGEADSLRCSPGDSDMESDWW